MFEKGDKYIHFTKYGGINFGEVEYYGHRTNVDSDNRVMYKIHYIITTKGPILDLDGSDGIIYKIDRELTDDECENIQNIASKLSKRKAEYQFEMTEKMKNGYCDDL